MGSLLRISIRRQFGMENMEEPIAAFTGSLLDLLLFISKHAQRRGDGSLHTLHPTLHPNGDSEQTAHVDNLQLQVRMFIFPQLDLRPSICSTPPLQITTSLLLRSYYNWESSLCLVESIDPCVVDSGTNGDIRVPDNALLKFKPNCDLPIKGLEVLSSCNGIICLYKPRSYDPYVICNPVIDEYVVVPQVEKGSICGSGFGFCSGTNQYKVLRFLSSSVGFGSPGIIKLEAEINTVGTNLWRGVGDAPLYLHLYSGGCFLNGALHWIVHDTENCFESMCCFNFGKERFQPFPGPSQFRGLPGQLQVEKILSLKSHG
ncbi:hypothetical protein RHGRI_009866 [Rhododendron griersonianum]|uniref:F-box associated beta-propeller type 1 domain-containing protein n=1 Tax=Rhododendron griersonianum TaxID=479676 RepID=A0AAV6KGG3_9ERIC|nr:hypothetical protein RHGRI_009866 [Rhododendron griersonianum]